MKKTDQAHTTTEELYILAKYMNDLIGLAGLSVFGYGVWLIKPEWALISVGVILMFVAYKSAKA